MRPVIDALKNWTLNRKLRRLRLTATLAWADTVIATLEAEWLTIQR